MTREQFVNNAATTLNGAINDTVTSVTVTDGSVFPATGDFRILVDAEIMLVTARATNVLTVIRGQDGTTAAAQLTLADATAILTSGNTTQYMDDTIGIESYTYGHYSLRQPHRMVNLAGTTLTASDFTWVNQASMTIADNPNGAGVTVIDGATTGNWSLLTKSMPATPYAVTCHFQVGPGHAIVGSSGTLMGLGARDSTSGRLLMTPLTLGDEISMWRYVDETTFSAIAAGALEIELRQDNIWMKFFDDGVDFFSYASTDGVKWFLTGTEARTAYLAAPDELFFSCHPRGKADKLFHIYSWVESAS